MRFPLPLLAALLPLLAGEILAADMQTGDLVFLPTAPRMEPLIVTLSINGRIFEGDFIVYRVSDSDWWLPEAPLIAAGVRVAPAGDLQSIDGAPHRRVRADGNTVFHYDPTSGEMSISFAAEHFENRRVRLAPSGNMPATPALPAVFLDYDLGLRTTSQTTTGDALVGAGASGNFGLVSSYWTFDSEGTQPVHLGSALTVDDARRHTTLVVGDAIAPASVGQLPLPVAGVSWFSNFEMDPGFITFPLPALRSASATAGSAVVHVNGAPAYQLATHPGALAIEDIPATSGAGHVELIERDLFGRETRIIEPFYIEPHLLRRGLSSFAVTVGAQRARNGERNFQYEDPFARGALRHGFSNWFTFNTAAEASRNLGNATLGADLLLGKLASASLGVSGSVSVSGSRTRTSLANESGATGWIWFASISRSTGNFSFAADVRQSHGSYLQLGGGERQPPDSAYHLQASAGFLGGTFSASAARTSYAHIADFDMMTLRYTHRLPWRGQLSIGGTYMEDAEKKRIDAQVNIVLPLGARHYAASTFATRSDSKQHETALTLGKSLSAGPGMGYDLSLTDHDSMDARANLYLRRQTWEASMSLAQSDSQAGAAARLRGGLVAADGHLFATRNADSSLILVESVGMERTPIRLNHQDMGTTGTDGFMLIPTQPFTAAKVTLDDSTLPLDLHLDRTTEDIALGRGQVGKVTFRARRMYSLNATLRFADGTTPEPGTPVAASGSPEPLPVGYDGMVYLTSDTPVRRYSLTGVHDECEFEVRFDHTAANNMHEAPTTLACQ